MPPSSFHSHSSLSGSDHGSSVSYLSASTSSLHMSIGNTSSASSHRDSMSNSHHNHTTNTNHSTATGNTIKQKGWLVMTSLLCLFSVLNFWKEASSVESKQWHRGVNYVSGMQDEFIQDYIDLEEIEADGLSDYIDTVKAPATSSGEQKPAHAANDTSFVALSQLVKPRTASCPDPTRIAPRVSDPIADLGEGRKIPRIVHQTGKTACLTEPFFKGAQSWMSALPNHSFYFHDDDAVDELLNRDWPMFPQLKNSMDCLKNAGGAAKADLWRYLAMWEYGGIYTDMDNLPGELFNETTISPDMDAFFLQERGGWISQYFFAISPKHPLMFLAVHDVMQQMHSLMDTGKFYVPAITGPGSTKRAFLYFTGTDERWGSSEEEVQKHSKPSKGLYQGWGNRTVSVEGSRKTSGQWVRRSAIGGKDKRQGWKHMNITNYQEMNHKESGKSCILQLHDKFANQQQQVEETLRTRRW